MDGKKITLNGTEYLLKPGMKAIIVFEELTDKPFEIKKDTDILAYIYACILAGTPDSKLDFGDMLDAFDDDTMMFARACDIALNVTSFDKIVNMAKEGGTEPKKV